jgi:hypothetical protein
VFQVVVERQMADDAGAGARAGQDGLIELKVIVFVRVAGSTYIARGEFLR